MFFSVRTRPTADVRSSIASWIARSKAARDFVSVAIASDESAYIDMYIYTQTQTHTQTQTQKQTQTQTL